VTHSVFTIGYANKPFTLFVQHLKRHGITALADIRSSPWSKTFPEFNEDRLKNSLRDEGILYVPLGEELGPRTKDRAFLKPNGQVDFSLLSKTATFQKGVSRLTQGIEKGYAIAMMCAEKDPAICHRSLLVGHFLYAEGWQINHIDYDGALESQTTLERRLMRNWNLEQPSMFESDDEMRELAWQKQCDRYAWIDPKFKTANTAMDCQ